MLSAFHNCREFIFGSNVNDDNGDDNNEREQQYMSVKMCTRARIINLKYNDPIQWLPLKKKLKRLISYVLRVVNNMREERSASEMMIELHACNSLVNNFLNFWGFF